MSGRRWYSASLKDVAWLDQDAQTIFLIFHSFVGKFGWVDQTRFAGKKNRQIKVNWASSSPATSIFEFNEYNLLPWVG